MVTRKSVQKRRKTQKNNDLKKRAIIATIIVLLVTLLLVIFGFTLKKQLFGPSASEVVTYLEDRYGKEQGFYVVDNDCVFLDAGSCRIQYSSSKISGRPFDVMVTQKGFKYNYTDDYLVAVYNKQLESYYRNYLNANSDYNLSYSVSIKENVAPNISFEDFVESDNIEVDVVLAHDYFEYGDYNYSTPYMPDNNRANNIRSVVLDLIFPDNSSKENKANSCHLGNLVYNSEKEKSVCRILLYEKR